MKIICCQRERERVIQACCVFTMPAFFYWLCIARKTKNKNKNAKTNFFSSFSITIIRIFLRKIARFLQMVEVGSKNIDKDILFKFFHF
jgi:cell division FtsZ-interacting protein ZapD